MLGISAGYGGMGSGQREQGVKWVVSCGHKSLS